MHYIVIILVVVLLISLLIRRPRESSAIDKALLDSKDPLIVDIESPPIQNYLGVFNGSGIISVIKIHQMQ